MDQTQELAYNKGIDRAKNKFIEDIKNLPNVPKEVYEAIKNDPKGTISAIWNGISGIPEDIWETGKTITSTNMVGDTPAEFEKLGEADMTVALNVVSAAISAGGVTVAKKGGTVVIEVAKDLKNTYILAKTPEGINFKIHQTRHLAIVDNFTQKAGISGGHNVNAFYDAVKEYGIKIVGEKSTNTKGIKIFNIRCLL